MGFIQLMNGDIIHYDSKNIIDVTKMSELVKKNLNTPSCCTVLFLRHDEKNEKDNIYALIKQCINCANIVIATEPIFKENRELYTFSIRVIDGCEIVEEKYPDLDINKHNHPIVKFPRIDLYVVRKINKYKVFTTHSMWRSTLIKYIKGKEDIYDMDMKKNLKEALSDVYRYNIKFDRNGCMCSWINENKEGDLLYFIDYRLKSEAIEEIVKYIET